MFEFEIANPSTQLEVFFWPNFEWRRANAPLFEI